MDKKQEYSTIDLHHHSKYSYEAPKATLTVKEILEYYRMLAELKNERVVIDGKEKLLPKRVVFSICDHNSSEGAYYAWKYINENQEKYKNLDFIPGIEIGVNCHRVLTYPDLKNKDEKYVFKHMHILAHAKPGKEKEFFKRTWVISMLNKMVIDPNNNCLYDKNIVATEKMQKQNKYISIGGQILAARNMLFDKFGVKVPYDCYKPCILDGASYETIRNIFLKESYDYIHLNSNVFDYMRERDAISLMSDCISSKTNAKDEKSIPIFPKKPQIIKDLASLHKIDILELNDILGDSATICFAHPYTLGIHNKTLIAIRDFKDVDISILPQEVQDEIKKRLNDPYLLKDGYFSINNIMENHSGKGYCIKGDDAGLVAFQIFYNNLLKKGVKIHGYEITKSFNRSDGLEKALNIIMDKYNLAVSFGSDYHFNGEDKFFFKDIKIRPNDQKKKSYFDKHRILAVDSSYFKLNRSGKDMLTPEENTVSFKINQYRYDDYQPPMPKRKEKIDDFTVVSSQANNQTPPRPMLPDDENYEL